MKYRGLYSRCPKCDQLSYWFEKGYGSRCENKECGYDPNKGGLNA